MLDFRLIKEALEKHFAEMSKKYDTLYGSYLDKDELWETYMNAIPPEHNKIYRIRREHDCSCCRHFIKQIGHVIGMKDGRVETIWDMDTGNEDWNKVCKTLSDYVKAAKGIYVYYSPEKRVGTDYNMDVDEDGNPITVEFAVWKICGISRWRALIASISH